MGQWALIAPDARSISSASVTHRVRAEHLTDTRPFRDAWQLGQRCLVPAESYDEPNAESGRNAWWRIHRADGRPMALAGVWLDWTDPGSGKTASSYAVITVDSSTHPLLQRMQMLEAGRPAAEREPRAVVPIADEAWDTWLHGSAEEALALLVLPDSSYYAAAPRVLVRKNSLRNVRRSFACPPPARSMVE